MTDIATTDDLFFTDTSLTREKAEAITDDALANADDGELFWNTVSLKASCLMTAG